MKETKIKLREHPKVREHTGLVITLSIIVVLLIGVFFLVIKLPNKPNFTDLDTLHQLNYEGKLNPDEGQIYNGYSFVKKDNLWHTNVQRGSTVYEATFNFPPSDVKDVPVSGTLSQNFIDTNLYYVTFDPTSEFLSHIAVTNYGLSRTLARAFGKDVKAACTNDESPDCAKVPLVTCDDEDKFTFFFKEDPAVEVIFDDNCVTISGKGETMVKAKDRLLLRWYGIMK